MQQIIAEMEAQLVHAPAPVPGDPTQSGLPDALIEQQAQLDRLDRSVATLARQGHARVARIRRLVAAGKVAEARASDAAGRLWVQIEEVTGLAELRAVQHAGGPLDATAALPYQWPVKPRITQAYGCTEFGMEPARGDCAHFHDGIDLGPGFGAEVGAAADGVVAYVGWGPSNDEDRAFIVVIAHADGNRTLYAHLQPKELVHAGQWVEAGETIGLVGNTGYSTGPHLHLEVTRDGEPIDPVSLIEPAAEPAEATPVEPIVDAGENVPTAPAEASPAPSPSSDPATLDVADDLPPASDPRQ